MAFSVVGPATTLASHPEVSLAGSNFEIDTDANLKADDAAPSIDWASVTENRVADKTSGATDDSFGQGTKEDTAVPTVVDGSIPPNKSDLKFFGLYQEGTGSSGFLNMYWARVQDPSGTTNMDFEFNQSNTASTNNVTPARQAGDLLVTYDLSKGGTHPTISLRTWDGSVWGPATDLTGSLTAAASINTSPIPVGEADGLGTLSPRTFGEAQISMAAIFTDPSVCTSIGSAYLKSRASDSFGSALKDFIAPVAVNLSNCGSINIHKQDDAGNALAGAVFSLYQDITPQGGVAPHGVEDTAIAGKTCTTDAITGNCTISAIAAGQYWVVETFTPAGYSQAADQHVTMTADATIALTFVDPRLRGAIRIQKSAKHKDLGTSPNLVATFTVSQSGNAIGTIITSSSGVGCLGGLLPGDYLVTETGIPAGYTAPAAQTATVSGSASCPSGGTLLNFTNTPRTDITISVDSQVVGGTNSTIVCKEGTTTIGSGATAANGDGSLTVSNLSPGTYTCTVVVDP